MGCNCKNSKKLEKMFNANSEKYDKKGIFGLLALKSINIVNKIILMLLIIVLTPIVVIILIWNYIFKDKLIFIIPKFLRKIIKKHRNE